MGYYTDYHLVIDGPDEEKKKLKAELCEKLPEEAEDVCFLFEYEDMKAKLYTLPNILEEIAHKYPKLLISLQGHGEYPMDVWDFRWKGKKSEYRKVEMPELKNKKLQLSNEQIIY